METQTNTDDWLQKEEETFGTPKQYEKLPPFKLLPNSITEVVIDYSKPFEKWNDTENDTIKAIIPLTINGIKMVWWLNIKNPVYREVIRAGREKIPSIKLLQTGTGKSTKYQIVK